MKDNYGDKVLVEADGDVVYLKVEDTVGIEGPAQAELTAAKARKLAKKLRTAADEIDPLAAPVVDEVAGSDFAVGDKVRIAADAWVSEPGGFVSEGHKGAVGEIDEIVGEDIYVRVGTLGQYVDPSCLTKVSDPETFTLTLTREQAETLTVVLAKVGGPHGRLDYKGRDSARTHASDVGEMLAAQGLDFCELDERPEYALDDAEAEPQSIYFAAYEK